MRAIWTGPGADALRWINVARTVDQRFAQPGRVQADEIFWLWRRAYIWINLAVSNLKRNTRPLDFIIEDFLGGLKAEAGARPCVEAMGDFFEITA